MSKRRGQSSHHRFAETLKAQVLDVLRPRYPGFGATRDSGCLRHWMIEAGLWRAALYADRLH
ncbi:MAG: hypothetical protein PHF75_02310 [Gallionella sp.]|nr:hypothetical protein [Gallionella sp.]